MAVPDFHFDFDAVKGQDFEEAVQNLFLQLEGHYNQHIKPAPIVFGGLKFSPPAPTQRVDAVSKTSVEPAPKRPMIDPDKIVAQPAVVHSGPIDLETIDDKTLNMKSFSIKDGKELGLKEGDTVLKGVTDKGTEVFDKLLPGYDQMPYGPVVQGESGRYNLKAGK